MRFTVAVGALPLYPVGATLTFARDAGADGVELLLTPAMLRRGSRAYAELARQRELPIRSVHALLRYRRISLERKIADDCASIAFAADIPGCEVVVLHSPETGPRMTPELQRWLVALSAAREASANRQLQLGIENRADNHDGVGPQYLDDMERLRRLAGEWDMGITFDIAHAASHGIDVTEAVSMVAPRVVNLHLSDAGEHARRGGIRNGLLRGHRLPGTGNLPLAKVMASLIHAGYDGLVTLELSPASLRAYWPFTVRKLLRSGLIGARELEASALAPSAALDPRRRAG